METKGFAEGVVSNKKAARRPLICCFHWIKLERAKGFEPSTPTLATANWYFRYRLRFQ